MTRVVLGSASSGRRRVLRSAGIDPLVVVSGVDEDAAIAELGDGPDPAAVVTALAEAKAQAVARQLDAEGVFHLLHPGPGETPLRSQIQMLEQVQPEVDSFGVPAAAAGEGVTGSPGSHGGSRGRSAAGKTRKSRS